MLRPDVSLYRALSKRPPRQPAHPHVVCDRRTACPPTVSSSVVTVPGRDARGYPPLTASSAVVTVPGRGAACCARPLACIALVVRQRQPAPLHVVRRSQSRGPEIHPRSGGVIASLVARIRVRK